MQPLYTYIIISSNVVLSNEQLFSMYSTAIAMKANEMTCYKAATSKSKFIAILQMPPITGIVLVVLFLGGARAEVSDLNDFLVEYINWGVSIFFHCTKLHESHWKQTNLKALHFCLTSYASVMNHYTLYISMQSM